MLTEISTVTGVNNLVVLGLRRWFGFVDSIQAAGLLTFTVDGFSLARKSAC